MNLISVNKISQSVSGRMLFKEATFGVDSDSRIAITGRNGCGKSTLLTLLAGQKKAEEGEISWNRELKTAFLEQSTCYDGEDTIADFVLSGDSREISLIKMYEKLVGNEEQKLDSDKLAELMAEMEDLDCWNLESRIHSILSELGIGDVNSKMRDLAGGMLKKAVLARTLVTESNLIILDEPTNHLDISTINWLEKYLMNSGKAIVLVTHDRYFMDSVCNRIFEIEDGNFFTYEGNYSRFLELKTLRQDSLDKAESRINNILRNEAEWISRGPRARAGKDKKRKERFFQLQGQVPGKKSESDNFSVAGRRLGGKIVDIENIGKAWGSKKIINDFSYSFKKGDRVGLLGGNGSGKTTMLNIIAGRLQPDKGNIDTGVNTKIGYYDQLSKELPGSMKAIEYIKETAEVIELRDGSRLSPEQFLERFLFPKGMFYTLIENLSGGEKKKLYLLKILLSNPNFIILDEPTNDFDVQTLSILEDFLCNFAGCSLIVSHDRFFLDRTTDFLFVLDGAGGVSGYSGDVTTYYSEIESAGGNKVSSAGKIKEKKKVVKREKKGLSFKEKQEFGNIEDEIMMLEEEKKILDVKFSSPDTSAAEFGIMKQRYEQLEACIEEKYNRWEFLDAKR
ncbi:MAG: ABC-F family ATP-binding cassette domain-containing protein [Spirochaetales bacterium]|uniref:ABC-F family ATP-binding cassette domain-containing protein n=1 Tax=Candidatus Thalassospirochaeta sargassi TaxID=3119039 RepID=A0AAJ1ICE0_9SPIO|nr:ABC-F family ATP-binding cassette domain-containing protein [Spirochaetales bacterium]